MNGEKFNRLVTDANAGDLIAVCHLGFCYEKGFEGLEQNSVESATWYLKGAKQGDFDAIRGIFRVCAGIADTDPIDTKKMLKVASVLGVEQKSENEIKSAFGHCGVVMCSKNFPKNEETMNHMESLGISPTRRLLPVPAKRDALNIDD
jgi:hypothetical protein